MKAPRALTPQELRHCCDPADIPFDLSSEITGSTEIIGQKRALDAIRFGTRIGGSGFNIFALGQPGTGKYTVVRRILEREAKARPAPSDWCYVFNFDKPQEPNALRLPAGRGARLQKDMAQFTEDLSNVIPAAFETDDYRNQLDALEQEFNDRRDTALNELARESKEQDIQLIHTPSGFAFAPLDKSGEVINPEQFKQLPDSEKQRIESTIGELQKQLQKIIRQMPLWQREVRGKIKELDRQVTRYAAGHLIGMLREQYADLKEVVSYLQAVESDIVEHAHEIRTSESDGAQIIAGTPGRQAVLRRYRVNLIVDHTGRDCAPVVYQDMPTHSNLVGRTEYQSQLGALITDFTLIKAGALHQSNGGYLILDARHLLTQAFAWESLKRALRSAEIRIEPLERSVGLVSTISLEPEPIPLDVKIVLIGERRLYYLLTQLDPEFREHFKVEADFADTLPRDGDSCAQFARMLAEITRRETLRPIDRSGAARMIEESARYAEDAGELSIHLREMRDVLREADYWADDAGSGVISATHVQRAVDEKTRRADRIRGETYDAIERGTISIATSGSEVGQINGLSVISLDEFSFGQPSRITATVRLGEGEVIDIERETELGGNIHTKGVMILSSFLSSRYAPEHPLSLSASLVFEQSYGMVDGDSASLAESCALLSALADAPIEQRFGVTGSVNQLGQVQAIGGVNEKIEGFYDVCARMGLSGDQAVLIPETNIRHLMLRPDVVEAVAEGRFHVYPVGTVDEAIAILTGVDAGALDKDGRFPGDSINGRVEDRLIELANLRRQFSHDDGKQSSTDDTHHNDPATNDD